MLSLKSITWPTARLSSFQSNISPFRLISISNSPADTRTPFQLFASPLRSTSGKMSGVPKQIFTYQNRTDKLNPIWNELGELDLVMALNWKVSHLERLNGITRCVSAYLHVFYIFAVSFTVSVPGIVNIRYR